MKFKKYLKISIFLALAIAGVLLLISKFAKPVLAFFGILLIACSLQVDGYLTQAEQMLQEWRYERAHNWGDFSYCAEQNRQLSEDEIKQNAVINYVKNANEFDEALGSGMRLASLAKGGFYTIDGLNLQNYEDFLRARAKQAEYFAPSELQAVNLRELLVISSKAAGFFKPVISANSYRNGYDVFLDESFIFEKIDGKLKLRARFLHIKDRMQREEETLKTPDLEDENRSIERLNYTLQAYKNAPYAPHYYRIDGCGNIDYRGEKAAKEFLREEGYEI